MRRLSLALVFAAATLVTAGAAPARAQAPDWSKNVYLRLDSGASFTTSPNHNFGTSDFDSSYLVSGGIGYRVMPHLRLDATVGYRGDYQFRQTLGALSGRAGIDATVGLDSAYYDIGTYAGFTPYLGAGLGASSNHFGRTALTFGALTGSVNGNTQTDFAYQLVGGVSYSITPNWALDFGYHYLDMGQLRTGNVTTIAGAGSFAVPRSVADLQAHEIQVGLRYSF